ncbi:organelle RRM domain-containing protein 6, chloroplastic-like [Salvia splendens]|uniref:organelle RRM domain-containing protein 6, chloroplastic-like n=1 Tax=Salvia splendens TaxID=180675 RepID=UPI001C28111C|nr:organelle RRM domain-containing protein 6, chloroplastic-like [Salvia splendens]
MAAPALNHRILPHRFLTPPPASSVTMAVLESKRRFHPPSPSLLSIHNNPPYFPQNFNFRVSSCLDSPSSTPRARLNPSKRLFVSGLSFRTTEESLRNAFKNFGELIEVKLVMDRIANRPRGFAFLQYKTEEESNEAVEGMHGKFLDGRVIFVEAAKPRAEHGRETKQQNPRQR